MCIYLLFTLAHVALAHEPNHREHHKPEMSAVIQSEVIDIFLLLSASSSLGCYLEKQLQLTLCETRAAPPSG